MDAAAGVGAVASLASMGLKAYGDVERGKGQQAADEFQAQQLERAAKYGKLQAEQVGAAMSQKLADSLANLDVQRAAQHTDPLSPTGVAIRGAAEDRGFEQKAITMDNIMEQTRQQNADAAYLRQAGHQALLMGQIGGAADIAGGLSSIGNPKFGLPDFTKLFRTG